MNLDRRQFIGAACCAGTAALAPRAVAASDEDPIGVRADFPVVRSGLYLNSAYITPVPTPVVDAARAFVESKAEKPIALDEMLKKTDEVRGQFAGFIGATPDEIGFLYATSEGENIVSSALDLKSGDNVVIDELHYTTTFVLYRHLQETRGIDLRIVKKSRFTQATEAEMRRALADVLGADMTIRFEFVEALPLGRTGKAQTVISTIPLPLFSAAAAEVWAEEERRAMVR